MTASVDMQQRYSPLYGRESHDKRNTPCITQIVKRTFFERGLLGDSKVSAVLAVGLYILRAILLTCAWLFIDGDTKQPSDHIVFSQRTGNKDVTDHTQLVVL
jgi:hypothetical protein